MTQEERQMVRETAKERKRERRRGSIVVGSLNRPESASEKRLERFQHGRERSQYAGIGGTEDNSKKADKVNAKKKN